MTLKHLVAAATVALGLHTAPALAQDAGAPDAEPPIVTPDPPLTYTPLDPLPRSSRPVSSVPIRLPWMVTVVAVDWMP